MPSANVYPPTLNFTAFPASITKGNFSTLSWSSQNAIDCFASGGWSGTKSTNGAQSIIPALSDIYTLTCAGAGGSATQSVTVSVLSSSDITPPSAPTGLNASALPIAVNLNWNASTDNIGVTEYWVHRNGAQIAAVAGNKYEDRNVSSGATYTYTVSASDAAGNFSNQSSPFTVTIPFQTSPGSIQGFKLKMPGNQSAMPPGGETVRLDNSSPLTANPYFFTNVSS
ncbi:MAG: hypothetical protein HYW71_00845, partial [Candidatus Niyogibacteria bacterium]|nr:hypothetical protein [Candidatus Niyogibacteria bacterium]